MTQAADRPALVGRDHELGTLLGALDDAVAGRGRLVMIGGDPGIGKTRLADEVATVARGRGLRALWGRGWQDAGAPPYWPWVQVVRAYLRTTDEATIRRQLGGDSRLLDQLLPELSGVRVPDEPAYAPGPSSRFRLFDAATRLLLAMASDAASVVVLDDLHAADAPSIELLRFLAPQVGDSGLLILATYRDAELTPDHPLTDGLADLARQPATRMLPLTGIADDGVAALLAAAGGRRPRPALVRSLGRLTGGNPLFVGEAIRLLGSDPSVEAVATARLEPVIPREVRETIRRRMLALGPATVDLLRIASALGPEFPVDVVAAAAGIPGGETLERLAPAAQAGLVIDLGSSTGFRFAHDLVRETLYAEIPAGDAARLHHQIATVLEGHYAGSGRVHLAELAHHFSRGFAFATGDAAKAYDYGVLAAHAASASLAFEEAARHVRLALLALDHLPDDPRERADRLIELGDAEARAGDLLSAQDAFRAAAELARANRLDTALARAALGYGGRFIWSRPGNDRHVVAQLEAALQLLGDDGDPTLRVYVMARLACALRSSVDRRADSDRLSATALELARQLGDPATLAYGLAGRFWATFWPTNPHDRREIARELLAVARGSSDGERTIDGHQTMCTVALELGQIDRARAEIELARHVAAELRQPTHVFALRTYEKVLALLEGRFEVAEAMLVADAAPPDINSARDNESTDAVHWFLIRREQGRSAEVEQQVRDAAAGAPWYPYLRAVLGCVLVDQGRVDEAREVLQRLARDGFRDLYPDSQWLAGACLAAELCGAVGDAATAEELHRQLSPFAGRHAIAHAEGSLGSVDRYLGLLAAATGRLDVAVAHFDDALAMDDRLGARPWAAHDLADRAMVLRSRALPVDLAAAGEDERHARDLAAELGMVALLHRLGGKLADAHMGPVATRSPQGVTGTFRLEGEYWTIAYGGASCRLRDSKGMRYLARLLAEPVRELHVLDLVRFAGATAADDDARSRPMARHDEMVAGVGDAGEVLDAEARRAYRDRIAELDAEIDEAEDWNDPERLARLRSERSQLVRQLAAALGIGGRARVVGSPAERARLSVSKAIRSSIGRIRAADPVLGRHLDVAIHTGTFCAYIPDPGLDVSWQT